LSTVHNSKAVYIVISFVYMNDNLV
jgi:hypothetical protein